MIYGTSEKPLGWRMMEVRRPARLQDTIDRQTAGVGWDGHSGAYGKYTGRIISISGPRGLQTNYRANGISNRNR